MLFRRALSQWLFPFFACLLLAQTVGAQAPATRSRPRIGVAFAGGSARGLAHVGVLKWLYEHHIPVDYVAGTSMGALVAGMYASGYSPDEMDAFLTKMDWPEALQVAPPYRQLSFRRKEDRREYPNAFEIGLRNGVRLPSGVSPGHGEGLAISRFTAPYGQMKSFNDLPTPFACVAADLVSGKAVVFREGDLFEALRSSMAIPGIFAPVQKGPMILVDGGVLNNLPVDVVKQMGADIVIAVTLGLPDTGDIASLSLVGIADRSLDIMIASNVMRSLQLADLVLAPDLKGLYATDFLKYPEFAKRGYDEAQRKQLFLERLAVDSSAWQAYLDERNQRRRSEAFTPQYVHVEGARKGQEESLEAMLQSLVGLPLNTRRVDAALTRLTGLGPYDRADYRAEKKDGQAGLRVAVREKTHGPPILNTSLEVEGTEIDDVRFGIGARLTVMDAGGPFSEWRTELRLGSVNRLASEYYWRIGGSRVFLAPRGFVDYSRTAVFSGSARVAYFRQEVLGTGIDLGFLAGFNNELRVGYEAQHLNAFVTTGSPLLPSVRGRSSVLRMQWIHDSRDSAVIPHRGVRAESGVRLVLEDPVTSNAYPVFESVVQLAAPLSRRTQFNAILAGGTTGGHKAGIPPFTLGGPFRLSALARDQFRGNNYYHGMFLVLRSLSDQPLSFLGSTYFGGGYELGNAFTDRKKAAPFHSGMFGIFSETTFGTLFFGASIGEQGERKVFFRLGRVF